ADAVSSVDGVSLLNVDPGRATNRTVFTFIGEPEAVVEAAFRAEQKAQELIDMRFHKGEHPRIGATDVLPLVPIEGVTMEEAVALARQLSKRVGEELGIPVYCYENAASMPSRRNLAACRSGQYEGLKLKISSADWKPDFGPCEFNSSVARSGASVIGARDFLLAVNFNLNTTSVELATDVAYDVRERGRAKREGDMASGKKIIDENGNVVMVPGTLKGVKAIGWYIEEYGIAQVSMNITDMNLTPLHKAFEEVSAKAAARGLRVTGTEIIGLLPLRAIVEAGEYYLNRQHCQTTNIAESEIVKIAVRSMGLSDITPFDPNKKIIEYLIEHR
ncbi:MAG: glutamate formimidoyltransferase, partial [Rikenellaceae bacterium]